MWKLMGAVLLTGGGLWLGLQTVGELTDRARALESWQNALVLLEGELAFRLPDLPRLLEDLSHRSLGPAGEALAAVCRDLSRLGEEPFSALWSQALRRTAGPLTERDMEPLFQLGGLLGRCGWEEQKLAAERTRLELERESARLREEVTRKGRAYGALGLSLGAFVTILLL